MASELFELMAEITRPASVPKPPRVGAYSARIYIQSVPVDVTYDMEGRDYPDNGIDPPERAMPVLVTADIGGVDVMPLSKYIDFQDRLDWAYADGDV